MIRRGVLVAVGLLAACDTPPMTLRFSLTDGDSYRCIGDTGNETTDCSDVTMLCKGVLSVRVVPPDHPEFPYISVCKVLAGGQNKLCSIAGVDLPAPAMPVKEQVLEVQMAVFPENALARDANGDPICPRLDFAANGFPEPLDSCTEADDPNGCPARPAVGGRAYYHPGDTETVVELGCIDLELLNGQTCSGESAVEVFASVNDFDTNALVGRSTADRLTVSIGEPKLIDMHYTLTSPTPLSRTGTEPPAWSETVTGIDPQGNYCLEVFEDVPQATRALTCRHGTPSSSTERIDVTGYLLSRTTLTQILTALGKPIFPDEGLVVGIVLDDSNKPSAGAVVTASLVGTTIQYLSEDRMSLTTTSTSSNGIWISNAPYNSIFGWEGHPNTSAFGGLIQGKVTIVILQENTTVTM